MTALVKGVAQTPEYDATDVLPEPDPDNCQGSRDGYRPACGQLPVDCPHNPQETQ